MGAVKFMVRCSKDCCEGGSVVRSSGEVRKDCGEVQQRLW